jgi:hypothetical protein
MNPARTFQLSLLTLAAATPCLANGASVDTASVLAVTVLLESLIVAILVFSTGLDFVGTFCTWAGITACTWFVMMLSLDAVSESLTRQTVGIAVTIAEVVVVVVEGWLLRLISSLSFLRRPGAKALSWGEASVISVIANGASLFIGFLIEQT